MDEVMNRVITFNISDSRSHCVMSLDLEKIAKSAGKYAYYMDYPTELDKRLNQKGKQYKELIMPISQARKICKMIVKYADPENFDSVSKIFEVNSKLSKIWEELRCQSMK